MNSKAKAEQEDIYNNHIDKAVAIMQNYGFPGLLRGQLVKLSGAMNFFKGALRQQGLTEGEIQDIEKMLQKEDEESGKSDT